MWIAFGGAVTGKVLGTTQDTFAAQGAVEDSGVVDDLLGIFAPAAAFEGVVRRVVLADVEHGAEVEIEAKQAQDLASEFAMLLD